MKYKIKILKTTPFDIENTLLSIDEFRSRYNYFINSDNSESFVIDYLKNDYKNDWHKIDLSKWFEVVELPENSFRVGDWVWHENLKQAFIVMINNSPLHKDWTPNCVSFDAANEFVDIYKRKATQEEINYYDLIYFADRTVLIGRYKSYYFNNNVWKEIIGVSRLILQYIEANKNLSEISVLVNSTSDVEHSYEATLSGITVGCKHIPHKEVIFIAKHLKLIP